METKRQAETAYRRAFQLFSQKAQQAQALAGLSGQDPKVVEAALIELQRAHTDYERCRDVWVRHLLGYTERRTPNAAPHDNDVRTIAELLWESAGRPEGTAAEDWRRAEEIIEKAAGLAIA
jgi:Protein of unknown function (DUF2934)